MKKKLRMTADEVMSSSVVVFFSSRRRHTRFDCDWSSDVCSSDLVIVDFYPIVDVNNNARNPIINIRSFGEDVQAVSRMAQAYIRGVQDGGMIATEIGRASCRERG